MPWRRRASCSRKSLAFVPGETAAVRLVSGGPCPCPVTKVRFLFGGAVGAHDVTLRVWDDAALADEPGSEFFSAEYALTPDDQALQVIDLSAEVLDASG